jgi:hypothetical protein
MLAGTATAILLREATGQHNSAEAELADPKARENHTTTSRWELLRIAVVTPLLQGGGYGPLRHPERYVF